MRLGIQNGVHTCKQNFRTKNLQSKRDLLQSTSSTLGVLRSTCSHVLLSASVEQSFWDGCLLGNFETEHSSLV